MSIASVFAATVLSFLSAVWLFIRSSPRAVFQTNEREEKVNPIECGAVFAGDSASAHRSAFGARVLFCKCSSIHLLILSIFQALLSSVSRARTREVALCWSNS